MTNSLSDDEGFVEALDNEHLVEILRERSDNSANQENISFDELIERLGFTREELEVDLGSQTFEQREHPELSTREWMLKSMDDGSGSLISKDNSSIKINKLSKGNSND